MHADAGVLRTEVVLVSRKHELDEKRWVYLDCGKFSGLAETMEEAIRYRFRTPHDEAVENGAPTGAVIIAGISMMIGSPARREGGLGSDSCCSGVSISRTMRA